MDNVGLQYIIVIIILQKFSEKLDSYDGRSQVQIECEHDKMQAPCVVMHLACGWVFSGCMKKECRQTRPNTCGLTVVARMTGTGVVASRLCLFRPGR